MADEKEKPAPEAPAPVIVPEQPAPSYVLRSDFESFSNRITDNFNVLTAQLLQGRAPAAPAPDAPKMPTEAEINEALERGDTSKLMASIGGQFAALKNSFDQRLAQLEETGSAAISGVVERTVLSTLPHYERFKTEINKELQKVPKNLRMDPNVHTMIHDAVVGNNITSLLKEEREKTLREAGVNPQNLPNGNTTRSPNVTTSDVPTPEEYFGKDAIDALTAVGRTIESEAHRHGFKTWPEYAKSLQAKDKDDNDATRH